LNLIFLKKITENNPRIYITGLALFFIFLIFLRVSHIKADPPSDLSWSAGYFGDEAGYAHNARNKVLFKKWVLDDYNPLYINPVLTFFDFISFKIFHPGILSLRFVALFWGILGIFFFYGTLRERLKSSWMILLGLALLETNYFFLMFTRLSLSDTLLTGWMLMTLFFWTIGLKSSAFRFLTGLSAVGVLSCKPTAAYFSVVVLAAFIFHALNKKSVMKQKPRDILKYVFPFLTGFISGITLWLLIFYIPHRAQFSSLASGWSLLSMPRDLHDYLNCVIGPKAPIVFQHFTWFPFIFLFCWFYLPVSLYRFIKKREDYNSLEFFSLLWLVIGYFALSGLRYRPSRYFISLVPPIIMLALFGLRFLSTFKFRFVKKNRIYYTIYCGWILLSFYLITKHTHVEYIVIIYGLILFLISAAIVWTYNRKASPEKHLKSAGYYAVILILSLAFTQNLYFYGKWWRHPLYQVVDTSQKVGKMARNGTIVGLWAPMICMENNNRALCVAPNWFNFQRPYTKYHFTHIFLWRGNNNSELRHALKPVLGSRFFRKWLIPIGHFSIKNAPAVLYKVKHKD